MKRTALSSYDADRSQVHRQSEILTSSTDSPPPSDMSHIKRACYGHSRGRRLGEICLILRARRTEARRSKAMNLTMLLTCRDIPFVVTVLPLCIPYKNDMSAIDPPPAAPHASTKERDRSTVESDSSASQVVTDIMSHTLTFVRRLQLKDTGQ